MSSSTENQYPIFGFVYPLVCCARMAPEWSWVRRRASCIAPRKVSSDTPDDAYSRAARVEMKRQGGGKVVHVTSLTSSMGLAGTSVYGMTKAALAQLAKTQAVEWAADNIQVNCLAPGFILTPLTERPLWGDEKKRAWLLGRIPAKRPGTPDDMVAAVLYMAGPGSSYLTGQMITVDGGVLAGGSWDD